MKSHHFESSHILVDIIILYYFYSWTEELHKKGINEPDSYDGVVSHPEWDVLECEVKWASGSNTASKASGRSGEK